MAKLTSKDNRTQSSKAQMKIIELEKKEKKTYEALAALINFVEGRGKYTINAVTNFVKFKKEVIVVALQLKSKRKQKASSLDPKFNVKHYEHAIRCASDSTYRDMAIQAANKDLSREAMVELIVALHKDCRDASRRVKESMVELRKLKKVNGDDVRQIFQGVVEAV